MLIDNKLDYLALSGLPSHDGGIDGMIFGDSLGLNVVCVQAWHYTSNNVERGEIDKFIGALEGRNGVFVTTSGFTSGARNKAEHTGSNSHIALIDGARHHEGGTGVHRVDDQADGVRGIMSEKEFAE